MKAFVLATLRLSLPYLLAASAGVLSERAGVVNFALEGLMLAGAFAAAVCAIETGSSALTLSAAALTGAAVAVGYYACTATRRTNQVLLGIAFNLGTLGLTRFLLKRFYDSASNSPRVELEVLFWPMALVAMLTLQLLLTRTVFGSRVTAAGDAPHALSAAKRSPVRTRFVALALSGVLCGLAGAGLVLEQHQFTDGMTAGRGYIAVAAVVFGAWRLLPVWAVCLLFAATEAADFALQQADLFPSQFAQMLPYVVCVVALALRGRLAKDAGRAPLVLGE